MTWHEFVARTAEITTSKQSDLCLFIRPQMQLLPLPITRFDEPFFPYGKSIISATQNIVCAYIFDLAAYLALGAAGIVALERTLGYVDKSTLKILHGPFAGSGYSAMAEPTALALDALTLSNISDLVTYLQQTPQAAFVLTNNPASIDTGGWLDFEQQQLGFRVDGTTRSTLRLVGDEVLHKQRGVDFEDTLRAALEALR